MFDLLFTSKTEKLFKSIRSEAYAEWESRISEFQRTNTIKEKKMIAFGVELYKHKLQDFTRDHRLSEQENLELQRIVAFFQIPDDDARAIKRDMGTMAIAGAVDFHLADERLSSDEKSNLEALAENLCISEEELEKIVQKKSVAIYETAISKAIADKYLSAYEESALAETASALGIDYANYVGKDLALQNELGYVVLLTGLENGYLPQPQETSIILKKGEVCYWQVPASLLITKSVVKGFEGAYSGVSFQIAKGMSYRVGATKGRPIRQDVTTQFPGVFVITNNRVVFSGPQKAFEITFRSLISFIPYSDGIGLNKTAKYYLLRFNDEKVSEVTCKVLSNAIAANT